VTVGVGGTIVAVVVGEGTVVCVGYGVLVGKGVRVAAGAGEMVSGWFDVPEQAPSTKARMVMRISKRFVFIESPFKYRQIVYPTL